ncbi:hypothetical protein Ahia01_001414600, partial [Argonauta hians]
MVIEDVERFSGPLALLLLLPVGVGRQATVDMDDINQNTSNRDNLERTVRSSVVGFSVDDGSLCFFVNLDDIGRCFGNVDNLASDVDRDARGVEYLTGCSCTFGGGVNVKCVDVGVNALTLLQVAAFDVHCVVIDGDVTELVDVLLQVATSDVLDVIDGDGTELVDADFDGVDNVDAVVICGSVSSRGCDVRNLGNLVA